MFDMLDATSNGYRAVWSIARGVGLGNWYTGGDAEPWDTMYIREPCEGLSEAQCSNVLGGGAEQCEYAISLHFDTNYSTLCPTTLHHLIIWLSHTIRGRDSGHQRSGADFVASSCGHCGEAVVAQADRLISDWTSTALVCSKYCPTRGTAERHLTVLLHQQYRSCATEAGGVSLLSKSSWRACCTCTKQTWSIGATWSRRMLRPVTVHD